jgi:hypothetical protein
MYQFVDRPVSALCPGSRLLLWATRGWAHARANGTCPPGAVAPAFLQCGAIAALPDLHRLLLLLEGDDSERLCVSPLAAARIGDIEAVLLQLFADALTRPHRARATIALMLADGTSNEGPQVATAFTALGAVSTCLMGKGLAPDGLSRELGARA